MLQSPEVMLLVWDVCDDTAPRGRDNNERGLNALLRFRGEEKQQNETAGGWSHCLIAATTLRYWYRNSCY
jgi:hypothetical protein